MEKATGLGPIAWADPEGGTGGFGPPPPLKNHKISDLKAILVWIPRKITKLPSHYSLLGHHRYASKTLFIRWRPDDGLFKVVFAPHLSKKNRCQSSTPSDKTFWNPRMCCV